MTILSSGNVGIGTTSPAALFDLNENNGTGYSGEKNWYFRNKHSSGVGQFNIEGGSKYVSIGASNASGGWLMVNGDFVIKNYSGGWNTSLYATAAGTVGIGTASPETNTALTVEGDGGLGPGLVRFKGTQSAPEGLLVQYTNGAPDNEGWAYYFVDTTTSRFIVRNDGDIENHDNDYGQLSDERIKDNITDANSQWDDIKALRVRNFEMKSDIEQYGAGEKVQIGVIAQEVELVSPYLVKHHEPNEFEKEQLGITDEVRGMKYSVLYMKAIKCLQEAMEKIETLEAKVEALEA
jgi:hypothetical protein